MGLYGQRIGCLSLVCADKAEASAVESQVKVWAHWPLVLACLPAHSCLAACQGMPPLDMIIFGVDMYMGICTHDSQLAKWGYQEPIPGRYLAGMRIHVRCGIMGLSIIRGLHQC